MSEPTGRRVPQDWTHVERYPYSAVLTSTTDRVERSLPLPAYRVAYDQGREGACVGFASSWLMSIFNRRFYDARWLWNEAKEIDQWPFTNPGDQNGTSVRASMDVLRTLGHSRIYRGRTYEPATSEGITTNRWATTVDEVRTSIAAGNPVVLGCNWYVNFDAPELDGGRRHWIGRGDLGRVRAGHAVCIYRASDRMQAVGIVNNWGTRYPLVMMPYETLGRLLDEQGEATLVTDRR
jgi:hypothetical protein